MLLGSSNTVTHRVNGYSVWFHYSRANENIEIRPFKSFQIFHATIFQILQIADLIMRTPLLLFSPCHYYPQELARVNERWNTEPSQNRY